MLYKRKHKHRGNKKGKEEKKSKKAQIVIENILTQISRTTNYISFLN